MAKILIVEDDLDFARSLAQVLQSERHVVDHVDTAADAQEYILASTYELVVLDWNLPDRSGLELCQELRRRGVQLPILMLTAQQSVDCKVQGFDSGADEYITKPCDIRELTARVRALLRRGRDAQPILLECGPLGVDPSAKLVTYDGAEIQLVPMEYAVLDFLMRHQKQNISYEMLIDRVWKTDSKASVEAVRTCMMSLRRKLFGNSRPNQISTVHGLGYRLDPPS
jgi:DNA-binding response OmpR family regulator